MVSLKSTGARLVAWVVRPSVRLPRAALTRALVWGLPLLGLEAIGRRSPGDAVDAAGVLGLAMLGLAAWIRYEAPLRARWKRGAGERWRARLRRLRPRIGLDFRRTPPLPRALPRPVAWVLGLSLGLCAVAIATLGAFPSDARSFLQGVSGVLMLAALTALWTVLVAGAVLGFLYPLFSIDLELSGSPERVGARRRLRTWGGGLWFLTLIACATWLPLQAALGALLGAALLFAFAVSLPFGHPLRFVWRRAATVPHGVGAACFSWSGFLASAALAFAALSVAISLFAVGDRLEGAGGGETSITAFLGTAFTWAVAGGAVYGLGEAAVDVFLCRVRDPARAAPVRVHLAGGAPEERDALARGLERAGLQLAPGRAPREMDVRLQVVSRSPGLDRFDLAGPRWPRPAAPADADDPELHRAVRRRAEIQRRRELYRGLAVLFKRAAARKGREGKGYWIAPHLWFITHLSRDGDDEDLWRIGPGYRTVLAREARHHFYTVLEALEVDLIFLEDGVGFRRFKRVLAMLFEYYDIFGGRRLDDERHFSGLPGVRVMLHEFELESSFRSTRYPEPDYEGVGRARILHVFRDRGGEEELDLVPFDWSTLPAPAAPSLVPV